jgi:hypothetical protein
MRERLLMPHKNCLTTQARLNNMRVRIRGAGSRRHFGSLPSPVFADSIWRLAPQIRRKNTGDLALKIDHAFCDHHERVIRRKLVWACLMGALRSRQTVRPGLECHAYAAQSILETGRSAAYSSLRRKKSHTESGERIRKLSTIRCERAGVSSGAISGWNLACVELKHDSVTCLEPYKQLQSQRQPLGEGI